MKKVISALLVTLLLISAVVGCFSASAAGTGLPTYSAESDKMVGRAEINKFWMNSLNNNKLTADKVYSTAVAATYNDGTSEKTIVKTPVADAEKETSYSNYKIYLQFGLVKCGIHADPITVDGAVSSTGYVAILCYEVESGATLNSFLFTTACDEIYGKTAFDGVTIYGSDSAWNETINWSTTYDEPLGLNSFTPLAQISNLNEGDKWITASTGDYKYYEANFSQPVTCKYLTLCWTSEDVKTVQTLCDNGEYSGAYFTFAEFAVFEETIVAGEEAPIPTDIPVADPVTTEEITTKDPDATTKAPVSTKKVETTKKAETTKAPETTTASETTKPAEKSGCGSAAAIGVAVIVSVLGCAVIRKKH